jgi:hypothetical protein
MMMPGSQSKQKVAKIQQVSLTVDLSSAADEIEDMLLSHEPDTREQTKTNEEMNTTSKITDLVHVQDLDESDEEDKTPEDTTEPDYTSGT